MKKQIAIQLNNTRIPKTSVLAYIKLYENPSRYYKTISSFPLLKSILFRRDTFHNIKDLALRPSYEYTDNFEKELYWASLDIINHLSDINRFLSLKEEFENNILLNNFEKAQKILDIIKESYGTSLWHIEMSFLLKEESEETKENWLLLSSTLQELNSSHYKFFANYYSKRVEKNMSYRHYLSQLEFEINSIEISDELKDFFVFKAMYNARYDFSSKSLNTILQQSNHYGYIDKYLILIDVIIRIIAKNEGFDQSLENLLNKLLKEINNDTRLTSLSSFLSEGIKHENHLSKSLLNIFDLFTKGQYEDVTKLSLNEIRIKPHEFLFYELYIKSLISQGKNFSKTNISNTIDQILENIFHILMYDDLYDECLSELYKLSNTYSSFNIGKQILGFVETIVSFEDQFINIGTLSASSITPPILSWLSPIRIDILLSNLSLSNIENTSFKVFLYLIGKENIELKDIDIKLLKFYEINHLFNRKQYKSVIENIGLIDLELIEPYVYAEIVKMLIISYMEESLFHEALQLTSKILLNKPKLFQIINIQAILESILNSEKEDLVKELIEYPILNSLVLKDYDLYVIYDDFICSINVDKPSDINIQTAFQTYSKEKVIYFLENVCTISTMRYSLLFNSLEEVELERITICELLIDHSLDENEKKKYNREISEILKTIAVRKAIKEVDNARLYVNIEALKKMCLKETEESFYRYKKIEELNNQKKLVGFNASNKDLWKEDQPEKTALEANDQHNDPVYLAFKTIYGELRHKFLYSKEYGLDSCLSTRIRHGALKNHIRSVFEKLYLVTSKSSDIYSDNIYWENIFSDTYNEEEMQIMQNSLKKFSEAIDYRTVYLVDNLIQIQTEKERIKNEGLFDFTTTDDLLYKYFNDIKSELTSAESTIDIIFKELSAVTQLHLSTFIQSFFRYKLKFSYLDLLNKIKEDIKAINNGSNELIANIVKAETDIELELNKISDWFTFRTTDSTAMLDIEVIINASKEYTNRINPNSKLNIDIKNYTNKDKIISSIQMIFVFNILFNNVIKHSLLDINENKISIDIYANSETNNIDICCSNNISEQVDLENINKKLLLVKSNWGNYENIERSNSEGESGFDKIKRIFFYEMNEKKNKFDYKLENEKVTIILSLPFTQN